MCASGTTESRFRIWACADDSVGRQEFGQTVAGDLREARFCSEQLAGRIERRSYPVRNAIALLIFLVLCSRPPKTARISVVAIFESLFCDKHGYKRLRRGVRNFFDLANLIVRNFFALTFWVVVSVCMLVGGIVGWIVYGNDWLQKIAAVFDKLPW